MVNITLSVRNALVDKSMLFTYFCLTQGQKLETWFVSPTSREYFSAEHTTFLSKNWKKKILPQGTAKYVFS